VARDGDWELDEGSGNLIKVGVFIDPTSNRVSPETPGKSLFRISLNADRDGVSYAPYAKIDGASFANCLPLGCFDGQQFSIGETQFMISADVGILQFENSLATPRYIEAFFPVTVVSTDAYIFLQESSGKIYRLERNGIVTAVQGLDGFELNSLELDAEGNVIVKGLQLSNSAKVIGRIRPEKNDIDLNIVPFDAEVSNLIRLN